MSSLPSISHHLYVAAVQDTAQARRKPNRPEAAARRLSHQVRAAQLELLDEARSLSADLARPLRATGVLGGSLSRV